MTSSLGFVIDGTPDYSRDGREMPNKGSEHPSITLYPRRKALRRACRRGASAREDWLSNQGKCCRCRYLKVLECKSKAALPPDDGQGRLLTKPDGASLV